MPRLASDGMAELRYVRAAGRRQAHDVARVAGRCLAQHRTVPSARRANAVRNCAFRPLAAAGASRGVNGMVLSDIGDRVAAGNCRRMISSYSALLAQFSTTAGEVLRTNGDWPQQLAAVRATARLASAIERQSRPTVWRRACAARAALQPEA